MEASPTSPHVDRLRPIETWRQDPSDLDLWHHQQGLIVNSEALSERETFYRVLRVGASDALYGQEQRLSNLAA
jgi:hypothetical protein